jgi:hypothetical protein
MIKKLKIPILFAIILLTPNISICQNLNPPQNLRYSEWCYSVNYMWDNPDLSSVNFIQFYIYKDSVLVDSTDKWYYSETYNDGLHTFGVSAFYDEGESIIISVGIVIPLGKKPNYPYMFNNINNIELWWLYPYGRFWVCYMNNYFLPYPSAYFTVDSGTCAIRWQIPKDIRSNLFVGEFTNVDFIPSDEEGGALEYHLKLFQGDSIPTLVHFQIIDSVQYNEWNTVEIDPPVLIPFTEDIWVGITIINDMNTQNRGGICYDDFIPCPGWGDLYSLDDQNWQTTGYGDWVIGAVYTNALFYPKNKLENKSNLNNRSSVVNQFNIYRNGEFLASTDNTNYLDTNFTLEDCGKYFEYYVEAVYNDCVSPPSDTVGDTLHCTVGLEENISTQIEIYPNPAKNYIIINSQESIISIEIFDNLGIVHNKIEKLYNNNNIKFNTGNLNSGIYYIKVQTKNKFYTKKLIIQ